MTKESKMKNDYQKALNALNNHQVIAFPTETVYGLGVFFDDYEAYQLLNKVKRRSEDKPYTMMLYDVNEIDKYAEVNAKYLPIIKKYMPGSLTILVKAKDNLPGYVTHNTGVIGIRIPENRVALSLLKTVKKPLLVPSANRANELPALSRKEVVSIFGKEVAYVLDGKIKGGHPSTIVDLTDDTPKLVRPGPITYDNIKKLI